MQLPRVSRPRLTLTATSLAAAVAAGSLGAGGATAAPLSPQVRVNQAGYATDEAKLALVMGDDRRIAKARFRVVDRGGKTVLRGRVGRRTGRWSARYRSVRSIDLSALRGPGEYRVRVAGAASLRFRVGPAATLLPELAVKNVRFFQAQRDGADVIPGVMKRQPSHLADRAASVYAPPTYDEDGVLIGRDLTRIGGPVDVSGGWFDAGDYLKFTHTTAYATAGLLLALRAAPDTPGLAAEAAVGVNWLDRMWDATTGTLYAQVGIGQGNDRVLTDHDVWRLPEADDQMTVGAGDRRGAIKHRPVFPANTPGQKVSPNLAGRVAAVFALAAQQAPDRAAAERWLTRAASIYQQADTAPAALVTAYPADFYPEESWQDDLEFGAIELARAASALGDPRAAAWQADATRWAHAYLESDVRGTLGLGDVSALAHADLMAAGSPASEALAADLRRQLSSGERHARRDPFRAAASLTEFDAVPLTFGFVATASLYEQATGDRRYRRFASQQRGWAFGANAWGTSFMVGAGRVYPRCPQHQVANLAGAGPLIGAVVNGPNKASALRELNGFEGMRRCRSTSSGLPWSQFDGRGARYLDDAGAWQTVEPAIDFTATALLALALPAG